jgi:hypothetical protein
MFSACEPIVDETNLVDSTTIEGVQLVAPKYPWGNKVTLGIATPITGYWNYNLGKALSTEVTIVHPIPGKTHLPLLAP